MRTYPALDVRWATASEDALDLLLADLDAIPPVAVEQNDVFARLFFDSPATRDRAAASFAGRSDISIALAEVSDEDWAARSQAALHAIEVGRLIVAPPWDVPANASTVIVIQPSMGFGTGHHATTRLCLRLLQHLDVQDRSVLDVGTGSGVLALAAARLGASRVTALDHDPDAIENARDNIALNDAAERVTASVVDLVSGMDVLSGVSRTGTGAFELILANLTGAALTRLATELAAALAPGGRLIVSGYLSTERDDVHNALERELLTVVDMDSEDEWRASLWSSPTTSTTR